MGKQVKLLHSVHRSELDKVLEAGLKASSDFDDLGLEMRRDVVYCWLRREDDKMSSGGQRPDHVYLEVTVDEGRCLVAEMDLASVAMTYLQGSGGRPKNAEASRLIPEAYRVTAVPLLEYEPSMFWTPEVLVKGAISSDCIRAITDRPDAALAPPP